MVVNTETSLQAAVDRLQSLTIFELRGEWRRLHRMAPPMRLSPDLLVRGIAYRLQEKSLGGLSKATLRQIAKLGDEAGSSTSGPLPLPVVLKPGTRLVREWHGETHSVLVGEDGFEWRGEQFASLSKVAHAITGTHWSGPRFFGLTQRPVAAPASGGAE